MNIRERNLVPKEVPVPAIPLQMLLRDRDPPGQLLLGKGLEGNPALVSEGPRHLHEAAFAQVVDVRIEGLDGLLLKGVGAQEAEALSEEGVDDPGLGDDDL